MLFQANRPLRKRLALLVLPVLLAACGAVPTATAAAVTVAESLSPPTAAWRRKKPGSAAT